MKFYIVLPLFIWLIGCSQQPPQKTAQNMRPNVIFIMADDLGWADTSLFGQTDYYETPNLQRLAERGMLFSRAYATPTCTPTRASLITGKHPARIGITRPVGHVDRVALKKDKPQRANRSLPFIDPGTLTRLDHNYDTLAEVFKSNGYKTSHFGKWHLGRSPYSPLEHGFDSDTPGWWHSGPTQSYLGPWGDPNFKPSFPGEHIEDRMALEIRNYINENLHEPMFINYWMFSVHAPFAGKPELIEKYSAKPKTDRFRQSPTYAAMIEAMDTAIGAVLDGIDDAGIADNTVIIFYSDNGGNAIQAVAGEDVPLNSNAPLRGGKGSLFEGGVRVPMIISWPNKIAPGTQSDRHVSSEDFFPTLVELLDLEIPKYLTFDGNSFAPALEGQSLSDTAKFVFVPHLVKKLNLPPAVAMYSGKWKLIRFFHVADDFEHSWMLFDLEADPGERINLAAEHPNTVKEMDRAINIFLQETEADIPLPNPEYNGEPLGPFIGVDPHPIAE